MAKDSHVAVVVPYCFVPPRNGGHKAAFGLCRFLAGHTSVTAVTTPGNEDTEALPFRLQSLLGNSVTRYLHPRGAVRIARYFKQAGVTQCIAFQPFIALLLFIPCRLRGVPLSIYIQNLEYQRFRSMGKAWWPIVFVVEWLAFRLSDHLYFISPDEVVPGQRAFGLQPEQCSVLPYGTPYARQPERQTARRRIRKQHGYSEDECLIIFFGPQTYQPNLEAVVRIVEQIEPAFRQIADFPYRFLICGGGLPGKYNRLQDYDRVDYLGYVEDIEAYVQACDLMANPVNSGGGVKTKLVEAIALGTTVVSSYTGALGVVPEACGPKLIRVADEAYPAFAAALQQAYQKGQLPTPSSFYETYYWGNIVRGVNH
ncbi:MAG: glycosyltransferase family 4 protein [Phaeodactylibacter sp.]|uniref:glycosyltransferase family 4 protein n=1 Tax=Phaeodactylibacter sp. TaxID=1940289 RepID=UPI0032EFC984